MHGNLPRSIDRARKIERHLRQHPDEIVIASKFGAVAKVLWPINTAATIAALAGKDERTGARWLSGEFEPPNIVLLAILAEIVPQRKP